MSIALRLSLGVLFFVASALKSLDFVVGTATPDSVGVLSFGNLLLAELELFLSLLLFAGIALDPLRRLLCVVFTAFAIKNAWSWSMAEATCGCLGSRVPVAPGIMFVADVFVLSLLVLVPLQRGMSHSKLAGATTMPLGLSGAHPSELGSSSP
jgi:hypothetical protein